MHFINTIKTENESFSPELSKALINPLQYNSELFNYFSHPKYSNYLTQFDHSLTNFETFGNNEVMSASSSHQNFQEYFSYQRNYNRFDLAEAEKKFLIQDNTNFQSCLGQVLNFQNDTSCLLHDLHDSSKNIYLDDTLDLHNISYSEDSAGNNTNI